MTHNGWRNYETWLTYVWATNDEGTYHSCRDLARQCWNSAEADDTFTKEERAKFNLADRLKEMIEDSNPLTKRADLYSDLLNAALAEIDWHEIANGFSEDMEE